MVSPRCGENRIQAAEKGVAADGACAPPLNAIPFDIPSSLRGCPSKTRVGNVFQVVGSLKGRLQVANCYGNE
jgi:hypothetical protein